ncbi:MAG: hypothetical protein M0006_04830 [Magnetospirillum sp.]|nr:hypothetical protein [Magnetospirillum sp.]
MKKISIIAALTIATLSACAQQPEVTSRIDRVKPGDNALTCPQIQAEIATMDKTIADANAAGDKAKTGTTAAEVATGALSMIPVVGIIPALAGGQVAGEQGNARAQAQQDAADAKLRKENLTTLGNAKNCFGGSGTTKAAGN